MLQLDEYDELIAEELKQEAEAERRRRAQAMSHPDPRDPERPDWNMRVPVISTAHLPGSDAIVDLGVLYAAYDCGYFVWMDGTIEAPWFVAIREWADQQTNDGWVRFDTDADPVPELPTYNW